MMMAMTFFGARYVPSRVRFYLAFGITLAVLPVLPEMPKIDMVSLKGMLTVLHQIVIGVAMGMVTQFISQTFVLLGQIIGMQSSLGFASMVDPNNGQNTPLLGQFYLFLITMIFLATDGHLQMLTLVIMSFESLPVGESLQMVDFRLLATWFGVMFKMALGMSLAAIIALLTINMSFGVMTRAAPQLNIFSLGFAFALLVGLLVSIYMLDEILGQYLIHWQQGVSTICDIIRLDCGLQGADHG